MRAEGEGRGRSHGPGGRKRCTLSHASFPHASFPHTSELSGRSARLCGRAGARRLVQNVKQQIKPTLLLRRQTLSHEPPPRTRAPTRWWVSSVGLVSLRPDRYTSLRPLHGPPPSRGPPPVPARTPTRRGREGTEGDRGASQGPVLTPCSHRVHTVFTPCSHTCSRRVHTRVQI